MKASKDVPHLEDWLSMPEVADALGVTKQAVHMMDFWSLRQVGDRAAYIVHRSEVAERKIARMEKATSRDKLRVERGLDPVHTIKKTVTALDTDWVMS